jgi:ubiquinone/menaquinone biosynthesis C-methylase UbiE
MSFDRLAPHYTWMERVLAGRRLQRCRITWLDELRDCENVLIAGVGHGHFLRAAAMRFPHLHIVNVDASREMLVQAQRRTADLESSRLEFVHAHLPDWKPAEGRFDAVVTPFFLDCFAPRDLASVISGLARGARQTARWLLTDFTVPAGGWKRHRARAIHATMYAFFRPVTRINARSVTPPDALLSSQGFKLYGRRTYNLGLLHADLWRRTATTPTTHPGA